MHMLDDRLLETKLGRLRARVERARAKLPVSREEFESSADTQEIVSFNVPENGSGWATALAGCVQVPAGCVQVPAG
jgi:hypothetical protein